MISYLGDELMDYQENLHIKMLYSSHYGSWNVWDM